MRSDLDDHAPEADPPSRDRNNVDEGIGFDDEPAVRWTRAYIAEREGSVTGVLLADVLTAARDADVDEDDVRHALDTLGLRERRNGKLRRRSSTDEDAEIAVGAEPAATGENVARRKPKVRDDAADEPVGEEPAATGENVARRKPKVRDDAADEPVGEDPRSERSNRAPGGKVRIIAVDLDGEGDVDPSPPLAIVVHIRCDEPGRLNAHLLVRDGQRGEAEAFAPERNVTHPGLYTVRCDIPADALGGLKHAVDVEAWLATANGTYASMDTYAQRFRASERARHRPFVQLAATWSEGIV